MLSVRTPSAHFLIQALSFCLLPFKCQKVVKRTLVQALRLCTGRTAHRGSRGIALPFHDHGTRRGLRGQRHVLAAFSPGKDPVPIVQEVVWAPGPVWTVRKISPPPGFNQRTVRPVASHLTDYVTRPTMNQVNNLNHAGGQSLLNKSYRDTVPHNSVRYPDLAMRSMSNIPDTYNDWKVAIQTQARHSTSWNVLQNTQRSNRYKHIKSQERCRRNLPDVMV